MWLVADPAELAETRRMAEEAAASYGLKASERFEFAFAVNEAVSNAIEHGSPSPEGTIRLSFAEEERGLVFCVQDYGEFTPQGKMYDQPSSRGRGARPDGDHGRGTRPVPGAPRARSFS